MAAPIKGTKQSDLNLLGTNKADKLQGKDGNDFITGGQGNDDIDGGNGFDTAVFSGSYFDYLIAAKGTGNDKITVTDSVSGRDGSDSLKHVEALKFSDGTLLVGQNNAAFTRSDSAATNEDTPVTIDVLANDHDFEGNALTITQIDGQAITVGGTVVLASGAEVTLNANQTLTYDPSTAFQSLVGGEQGTDAFTYTVTDSQGASSSPENVSVTVDGLWEAPTYTVNGTVDESAQQPGTDDLIIGSGIPASGFGLVRAEDAGIELGLQVIYRQGPTVTTADDYADGILQYSVAGGAQSTANGSQSNVANRASWNFEYSIATGLNGATTDLDDFTFKLLVDTDSSDALSLQELLLVYDPATNNSADASGYVWKAGAVTAIPDDDGSATVTQNSQNLAFYGIGDYNAGNGFAGGGKTFDVILQAFDSSNNLIAQNHISVDVL